MKEFIKHFTEALGRFCCSLRRRRRWNTAGREQEER